MNILLETLYIQLSKQLGELDLELKTLQEKNSMLEKNLCILQERIQESCSITNLIVPEKEISRLNFLIQQQLDYENLIQQKKDIEINHASIQERKILLKKKLKMIQHYHTTQQAQMDKQVLLNEQKKTDELVIQKKFLLID